MHDGRRTITRVPGPFEAIWSGHSGARTCRLTDISEGGCFVETRALAAVGETVMVQPTLPGHAPDLRLEGTVIYTIANMGFAVQFLFRPELLPTLRQALEAVVDYTTASP